MSEVQARPAASRGRGSGRGGRGGLASRGGRTSGRANGDKENQKPELEAAAAFGDDAELAELRKLYGNKTSLIKEMFPDWSEVDILFALQETDGDENVTVTRIAEGSISQWGEVSKPKKAPRAKTKDAPASAPTESASTRPARGGRNVSEGGRGRGRATERGGRGGRGRSSHAATNGHRAKENLSVPTEESSAWNSEAKSEAWADTDNVGWDTTDPATKTTTAPTTTDSKQTAAPSAQKTWASMLRQSTAPKAAPKPKEPPVTKAAEVIEPLPPVEPAAEPEPPRTEPVDTVEQPAPVDVPTVIEPEVALLPSKDQLTETNLEQVLDDSKPAATGTAASTAADSWDPHQNAASANVTPLSASQAKHQPRGAAVPAAPPSSGYAASAIKATAERRTPSYQRRILDQEEAVRMPGNREVDRAAVQFGAFSLNGADDDIDGDREEPETRAQPPADSPVAHPRTSLPPVSQPASVPEAYPAQKPTVALPAPAALPANATGPAAQAPPASQAAPVAPQSNQQFGRFGQQQPAAQEPSTFVQKPFDSFPQGNTASTQTQFDNYPSQPSQAQSQPPGGAFTSAPSEHTNYYTSDSQNRTPFNHYYGASQFGQQQGGVQGHQENAPQQRSFSGYNANQVADNLSQYPQSGHGQARYGAAVNDAQNSGHTTPNPSTQTQQQGQGTQPQSHGQQPHSSYYSNHPYFNHPYYSNYMGYGGGYNQGGYGAGPYGKGGAYGQPYGMSAQGPHDYSSSPGTAGFGGQSSLHRADSGLGSGLGDFGRASSAQSSNQQGAGASGGFGGGVHDTFGRGGSAFQSQAGQGFNQSQPSNTASGNDDLKPFGDSKTGAGPSPSLGGNRPGSATQNAPTGQTGLPPQQSGGHMGGYGGYPNQHGGQHAGHGVLHGSGYGGMGGNASGGQHGNNAYPYGGQGFGSGYYGGGGQQQTQQRGWGGNYH